MDGAILPLNFYCRSARLCLKRAAQSKKSHLYAEELQHLKAFETLVLSTIPGHPLYSAKKEEKSLVEIRSHLNDAKKRIVKIEVSNRTTNQEQSSNSNVKEPKTGKGDNTLQTNNRAPNKLRKPGARSPGTPEGPSSKVKRTGSGSGSRSESSTPLKSHRNESRSPKSGPPNRTGKTQNKIRTLPRKLLEDSLKEKQNQDSGSPKMHDTYAFLSKSAPTSRKTTPILRLRSVTECLGGESPRRPKEKDKPSPVAKVESLSRGSSPLRDKTVREMPRLKALRLVSSNAGKAPSSATTAVPLRFDNSMSTSNPVGGSEDDGEMSNSRLKVNRLSPSIAQKSTGMEPSFTRRDKGCKEIKKGLQSCDLVLGDAPQLSSHSAGREVNRGDEAQVREVDQGAESHRRDEAAWTTIRLQEQFGEALKELDGLQDRDTTGGLGVTDKCSLHGHISVGGKNNSHQIGSPLQEHNGRMEKMQHGWKSGLHDLKVERVQEFGDGEAYSKQRGTGGFGEYVNDDSEKSGRNSFEKAPGPRKRVQPRELSYEEHNLGKEYANVTSGHNSGDGSEKSDRKDTLRGVRKDCDRFRQQMKALKVMAEDSRTREFALHQDAEPVAKRRCDANHAEPKVANNRMVKPRKSICRDEKGGAKGFKEVADESAGGESELDDRRRTESSSHHRPSSRAGHTHASQPRRENSKNKNKAKKSSSKFPPSPSVSIPSPTTLSSSSSSSSLSSLPLSHYIQKLKHLAPESRFLPSPTNRSKHGNSSPVHPSTALSKFPHSLGFTEHKHHTPEPDNCRMEEDLDGRRTTSPAKILLPKSPPSSHTLSARIQQRIGHLYKAKPGTELRQGRHPDSDQRLDAVLGGCALVASHLRISPERRDRKENDYKSHKLLTANEGSDAHDCLLSIVGHKRHEKQTETFDGSMAGLQRLVGELKGSVEGFKIRIEVESEGWRSRVEGLQKEVETLKDKRDDELVEIKKCIRNEVKVRMGELSAEVERIRQEEKEQVENFVQKRIESYFNGSNTAVVVDLKKEIRSLWAEVETLTKEREEMKQHMSRLAQTGEEAKESTNRELRTLRREIRVDENHEDVKKETEDKAEMKQALGKIKDEGLELKMELNGLKKGEKGIRADLESVKVMIRRIQEDADETGRDRGAAQMEGVRERLLIMERVESLSQLYLGGLEEVRTDVYNVKLHCRDRMDELESQWGEYKQQREMGIDEDHTCVQKQRLRHEMEHFRSEVADMMGAERGLLRETLEREHECIRRQMIEINNSTKNELSCMFKVEMQKRNQASNKVMPFSEPMKRDMDRLRMEFEEAQQGIEAIAQTLSIVERERDIAAQAASEATSAAEKAGDVLSELLGPFTSEMATSRRQSLALQDNISYEKDAVTQAVAEAKKWSAEFQEFLAQEKTRVRNAVSLVQHERDTAAAAALDTSKSAIKAGEVLAEVLGSFNQEMNKARRKSSQLQEGLDRERDNLERDREEVIRKSHEAQERFNEELERAITSWKRAMNQEVTKAKQITGGLEEGRQRVFLNKEQIPGHISVDNEYLEKTNEALSNLRAVVKRIEESSHTLQEEKHRRRSLKQDTRTKQEQDQKMEYMMVKEKMDEAVRREEILRDLVDESASRVKKLEELHVDLLQSFQDVRASTGDIEKTASIWLPKYENAARIVHEINSKVEKLEEKCKGLSGDEGLMQKMAHVAESKFETLKNLVAGTDLKDLFQKVENGDRAQSKARSMLEARISQLESTVRHGGEGLSLKLEYIEDDLEGDAPTDVAGLAQTVEALQSKIEVLTAPRQTDDEKAPLVAGSDTALDMDSKINSLESRIELVASATFTNLRLLDSKLEECNASAQQALEGAATAENKCSALGVELVKVFRMIASSRQEASPAPLQRTRSPLSCGRDHSPTKTQSGPSPPPIRSGPSPPRIRPGPSPPRIRSGSSPPRVRSPLNRGQQLPKPVFSRRSTSKLRGGSDFTKSTMASEMRKVTTRNEQVETEEEFLLLGDRADSARDRVETRDQRLQVRENEAVTQALCLHEGQPSDKGVQEVIIGRTHGVHEGEIKGLGRFTISQDRVDDKHKDGGNKGQRTNIRLEAGRIHVNSRYHEEKCSAQLKPASVTPFEPHTTFPRARRTRIKEYRLRLESNHKRHALHRFMREPRM